MAEVYTYNGLYTQRAKELYTPAGETAEAYVYDGAAQQFWPVVNSSIPLVSQDADPANPRYDGGDYGTNTLRLFPGHNVPVEAGSLAETYGIQYARCIGSVRAGSAGFEPRRNGFYLVLEDPLPAGSPVSLLSPSPFDVGSHATDRPRYNLGSYSLMRRDQSYPYTQRSTVTKHLKEVYTWDQDEEDTDALGCGWRDTLANTDRPNNLSYAMPILRFHSPDPVLIGEAVGTMVVNPGNSNTDPYWIPDGGVVPKAWLDFENCEACTKLYLDKDFGNDLSYIELSLTRSPSQYGEDATEWLNNEVGLLRITFERIEDNGFGLTPETWVYNDGVTTATAGNVRHESPAAAEYYSNFMFDATDGSTVGDTYRLSYGDKLRVRIYKYPY